MKITVWSILSGHLSGHLVLNVPATHTLRKVLQAYCTHKGVSVSDEYVMRSRDNHILNLNKTLSQAGLEDGDSLMIGLLSDEKQTFSFGSWYFVAGVSFFIGLLGIGCVVWLCVQVFPRPKQFGVVVDAGSSHSEMFLFSWDAEKLRGTGDVELVNRCFMPGGIDSFASHPDDLKEYFKPCLTETKQLIPANQRSNTPLYLGATAGMRILRKFDCDGSHKVLSALQHAFTSDASFKFKSQDIEILPGFEEGISGWIAVNYLATNLRKDAATASVLDVGGASLQLTREVSGPHLWRTMPVTLFNNTYKVASKSYLCYGIGEARQRYDYFLLNKNKEEKLGPTERYTDPCLVEGLTRQISLEQLRGPCTLTDDSQPLLTQAFKINHKKMERIFKNYRRNNVDVAVDEAHLEDEGNKTESERTITLHGSGDAVKCEEQMRHLFDKSLCESTFKFGDCMGTKSTAFYNGTLYAFSGLFDHLMEALHLDMSGGASLGMFKGVVSSTCDMDATQLAIMFSGLDSEIVEDLCFDGMFVYTLLTAGLGVNSNTWNNIKFTEKIHNTEVVWPQGYILNKTSSMPSQASSRSVSLTTFILLLCLFFAFIICGFLFLHHSLKIRRRSTSYQRFIADHIDQELEKFIK